MKLQVAFSPCPNDTFIFDAWVHEKIHSDPGLEFEWLVEGLELLNARARAEGPDVCKMSLANYSRLRDKYQILSAGSALGRACGPLLIAKSKFTQHEISDATIAVPGEHTTANALLKMAYPAAKNKTVLSFSEIEDSVLRGKADLGLLIHESRFTYREKGLLKIRDLGEFWEEKTGLPIPLGIIAVKRDLPVDVKGVIANYMTQSTEYAIKHPREAVGFMRKHAQEMDEKVMQEHIALYVNEFTRDLGEEGRDAIRYFLGISHSDHEGSSENSNKIFHE